MAHFNKPALISILILVGFSLSNGQALGENEEDIAEFTKYTLNVGVKDNCYLPKQNKCYGTVQKCCPDVAKDGQVKCCTSCPKNFHLATNDICKSN